MLAGLEKWNVSLAICDVLADGGLCFASPFLHDEEVPLNLFELMLVEQA
jgi:hypothetical protein